MHQISLRPKFLYIKNLYIGPCSLQVLFIFDLLKLIRCKCKSTSCNQCGNYLWSCRRNGPSSVSPYEKCRAVACFISVEEDIAYIIGNQEEDHDDEDRNLFDDLFL